MANLRFIARELVSRMRRLRWRLWSIHPTVVLGSGLIVARDVTMGPYGQLGDWCRIYPGTRIGKYVMLAPEVAVVGADHLVDVVGVPMIYAGRPAMPETRIEDDVWIGHRAVILAGTAVRRGAIIGAGAVVTKDVPAYEIWAGVPARKIGERFSTVDQRERHDAMLSLPPRRGSRCPPLSFSAEHFESN